MRIWLIGADKIGSEALQQLQKNPAITVIVMMPVTAQRRPVTV